MFRSIVPLVAVSFVSAAFLSLGAGCSDADAKGKLSGSLEGAGASFPAPLYQAWFRKYRDEAQPNVRVNYTSQGSSAGVRAIIDGTSDFGASDAAMKDSEIAEVDAKRGMLMLPMTAGAVVVAHNAPIEGLKLNRETLAGVFMGEITSWNDPAIAEVNQGVALPDAKINVFVRSDGSGTTYAFTNHLSAISDSWRTQFGTNKSINWPDSFRRAKGNEGVTQAIQQTENSIGYIEFSYASKNGIATAALQNKAGQFVEPSIASFQAALAGEELPENMRLFIPDPAGEGSFPIVTYTWILAYKKYEDANKVEILKDVLNWCLTEGQSYSEENGYVPLPTSVTDKVKQAVSTISGSS